MTAATLAMIFAAGLAAAVVAAVLIAAASAKRAATATLKAEMKEVDSAHAQDIRQRADEARSSGVADPVASLREAGFLRD